MNRNPSSPCRNYSRERLLLYAYEELDKGEAELIRRHLAECEVCRAEVEAVAAVRSAASDPALPENPPSSLEAKLRIAAREALAAGTGRRGRLLGWLRQPQLWYAVAGVAAVVLVAGLSYRSWESRQLRPEDLGSEGLAALVEEVDSWKSPPLAMLEQEPAVSSLDKLEAELRATPAEGTAEPWYWPTPATGLDDIERGLEDLDSSVRFF